MEAIRVMLHRLIFSHLSMPSLSTPPPAFHPYPTHLNALDPQHVQCVLVIHCMVDLGLFPVAAAEQYVKAVREPAYIRV